MVRHEFTIGASLLALALVAAPALASAQSIAAAEPAAQADSEDGAGDQDIVVTAQRREQRLQEAPVAVTALSSDSLEQLNVRSTQDLMQVVPSLQVSTQTAGDGGGSATFFLRGMGQQRSGNGSEPAVGVYVDDFYYPSLSGTLFKIVDLAQLEVLRGPQGTLFGRNTIGGAIRYTTRNAQLGDFSGHVTGTAGNYDRYDISAAVNVPIGDFAALRVTGGHLQQDGIVKVQSGGPNAGATRTDLVRGQLRVEPVSALTIDISGQWSRDKLDGFTYNLPGPLTPRPPAPGQQPTLPFIYNLTRAGPLGTAPYSDALRSTCFYCQPGTFRREFSETTYKNLLATIGWDIGSGLSLKSLTGWQEVETISSADLDGTPLRIFGGSVGKSFTRAFSQELQLNGRLADGRLNFVAGGYYYNQRNPIGIQISPADVLGTPSAPPATFEARTTKSKAGYIDGSFKLTDKFSLLGGFRYSEDRKTVRVTANPSGALVDSAAATFGSSTFRAGLQYQWTPDIMSYANVSTGFRGGGFNPRDTVQKPAIQPFDPEKSTSYEAGLRLQFLDRRVTINPTAFYVDWTNIQVQSVVITDAATGTGSVILQNAGKARSYGFELEWAVRPTDHVRLFGSFAYLNLHYTDVGRASGITVNSELQRAPPITFALGGSHTIDLADGGSVVSTLNYSFQDDQRSTPTNSDALNLPAYGLLNGRIEFTDSSKRFSIAAFVTNILDKQYVVGGVNYYSNVGSAHFDVGRPREFGVTGRFNF